MRIPVTLGLLSALAVAAPAVAAEPDRSAPLADELDVGAELGAARLELERIAGPRLARSEAPSLPTLEPFALADEEVALVQRLRAAHPREWSGEERSELAALLDRRGELLASLARPAGPPREDADVTAAILPLLRAVRLLELRGRLALLDGREALFVDGLEQRADFVERLALQGTILGQMLSTSLRLGVLGDAQLAVESPATRAATLESLDALLAAWQDLPDAAAAIAAEGLFMLDKAADAQQTMTAREASSYIRMTLAAAEDYVTLARNCRQGSCGPPERQEGTAGKDPGRVIAELLLPNILFAAKRHELAIGLTEAARTATTLRLSAIEGAPYPASLASLPATLAAARGELAALEYELTPDGGARLRWTGELPETVGPGAELQVRLAEWTLPTVAATP